MGNVKENGDHTLAKNPASLLLTLCWILSKEGLFNGFKSWTKEIIYSENLERKGLKEFEGIPWFLKVHVIKGNV